RAPRGSCGGGLVRSVDGEDLRDHRLTRGEAGLVVAAERVFEEVREALVAVRAGVRRPVVALLEQAEEIRVGEERSGDRDGVARPALDRLLDHRRRLEAAA